MDPHPPARFDPRQPFTRAEARAAGITERELLSGRFRKIHYDTYIDASVVVGPEVRARAALHVACADSYISHHSAAELWGLPVPADGFTHLSVTARAERLRRVGIKSHLGQPDAARTRLRDLPITTPEQTFLDLAAYRMPLVDLVCVGDAMVRAELASHDSLHAAVDHWSGTGVQLARHALSLVRTGVDSPMETRLRLLIVFAGLPEPQVNHIVRADDGSWRMRFDLWYPPHGVLVEYDGRKHTEDMDQWEHDIYRREELDRMGLRLLVVISRGIYTQPERTLVRIRDVLAERGARVPRQFATEWRRHFAG